MDIVDFKNSMSSFVKEGEIIAKIVEKVRALPDFGVMKFNLELIVYVGSILEHEIEGKSHEERKALIIKVLKMVFPTCTAEDVKIFESSITFLQENKKIKKVSTFKYITKSVANFFIKKA